MQIQKNSIPKKLLAVVMTFAMLATMIVPVAFAAPANITKWSGLAGGDILIKDTISRITDDVTEHEVVTNNARGNDQKIDYMCSVKLSDTIKFAACYGNDDASSWGMYPTTHQAKAYEEHHPGETVVAAINADFFNMATGEPQGALVMEGEIKHGANGRWYFAVLKDGTPVIRNTPDLSDCQTAVGGLVPLVLNGNLCPENYGYGVEDYSRCTIGIMKDGTVVTSVTYGRLPPVSCGRTYQEIAEMYYNEGCQDVLVLDGGGSATYCAKVEGSDTLEVRNTPSDGAEREVSSSLLIVSTAAQTGVFDHAVLEPNNTVYTPGSSVQFTAGGVDTAGFNMELPEGTVWSLASDSTELGTIDAETGVFTAGETEGTVTVELVYGETVIGTTTIDIATPDQIYFNTEEISLGFDAVSDFNIVVRNKGRDIIFKDGDLVWTSATEGLGTFENNTFIANSENSLNGDVTVTSAYDENVSGSIHVIVGMLPAVIFDFEDYVDPDTGAVTPASEYYIKSNENPSGILNTSNYGRGGNESIEIASIDDDEPVRFGSHSLKLNFDFTNCGAVTEGACIGSSDGMTIPGTPTGLGVWVYAPDGVGVDWPNDDGIAGLWLRAYVTNGQGSRSEVNYTFEPKALKEGEKAGIYWKGWKYLEADLTGFLAPFSIEPGMTFRLMFVYGINMVGTQRTGSIYLDNFQFVYGTNVDDTDNPVVDSVLANGTELENGAVLDTGDISITANYSDVQNKYTTGVDKNLVRIYVDGINTFENDDYKYDNGAYKFQIKDETEAYLYDLSLEDGIHTISVVVRDGFGNETTETREFTVNSGKTVDHSVVTVGASETEAILGKQVNINIYASGNDVARSMTTLKLNNLFKNYHVVYSDNYEGTDSFSNLSENITVSAVRKEGASAEDDNLIAKVVVDVPTTLNATDKLNYTVIGGCYETADGVYSSYYYPTTEIPVGAAYKINTVNVITGVPTTIEVVDNTGAPAANVALYYAANNSQIPDAVTGEDGKVTTSVFSASAGNTVIYAKDAEGLLSFQTSVYTFDPAGDESPMPYGVMFNITQDSATEKSLSWYSNVKLSGEQFIKYTVSGTEDWVTVKANQKEVTYTKGGNTAATVNSIVLTGLTADTEYDYVVGNGDYWTEPAKFATTAEKLDDVNFFVLGDVQAEDTTNIEAIMAELNKDHYTFGIQTGDTVDDTVKYDDWMDVVKLFGAENLGDTDMVHVLGNHEYAGDAYAERAAAVYNLTESAYGSHYSVTYGDVYIAVINYTGTAAQLQAALDWLKEDAKASDATWKILCMHQPAYYTNAVGGNQEIYRYVPDAVEEAGINVVFSGHDHSCARTNQLTDDAIDTENGILYYICGSSGEKSYPITSQNDFDYDTIFGFAPTLDFNAIYLTANADKDHLTININDVEKGLLDSVTLDSICVRNGHTEKYDPAAGKIACTVCGEENTAYTGEIDDIDGNTYYFIQGVMKTGWTPDGEDFLYYNKTTGIKETVTKTEDIPTTCLSRGHYVLTAASGATKTINYSQAAGHEYELQEDGSYVCKNCGYKRIEISECQIVLPYTSMTYSGKGLVPYPSVYAPDGTKMTGYQESSDRLERDFQVVYSNNVNVGKGTVTVKAYTGGFYINITEWRSRYGGTADVTFDIRPDAPNNLTASVTGNKAELAWTAAKAEASCPITYIVQASTNGGSTWTKIGETTEKSFTAEGLNANTAYSFRVRSSAVVDGTKYTSIKFSNVATANTLKCLDVKDAVITVSNTEYTGEAITPAITVKYGDTVLTEGTDYTVRLENNVNAGFGTVHVDGINDYIGTAYEGFHIAAQDITDTAEAVVDTAEVTYNENGAVNTFTVTDKNGNVLVADTDYTVTYENNTGIGTATATITGTGNYTGTLTAEFTVAELEGHVVTLVPEVPATCTEEGVAAYYKCILCDKQFSDETAATEVTAEDLVILPLRHVWSDEYVYTWTETEDAYALTRVKTCLRDGCDGTTEAENAEVTYEVTVPAACEAEGEGTYTGVFTGETPYTDTKTVVIPAAGHTWGEASYEWTETASGYDCTATAACTTEGCTAEPATETVTAEMVVVTPATCTENGEGKYVAEFTNEIFESAEKTVTIEATGHDYTDGACANCGKLAAPTVSVTNLEQDGYVTLTWAAVPGAVKYTVYRAASADGEFECMISTTKLAYTNTRATAGETYYYKVFAVAEDETKNSDFSEAVIGICKCAVPVITAENAPNTGYVKLSWEAVDGAVKYNVYRATSETGTYKLMKTTEALTYTNTSGVAGTTYFYKVKAIAANEAANSSYSLIKQRTCDCASPVVTTSVNAYGKPVITWEAVTGAVSYKVYRSTTPDGTYKLMLTTENTTCTNTGAVPGTTYYYKVKAIAENTNANSAMSAAKKRTCDYAKPVVKAGLSSAGKPVLTWAAVEGATGYKVYRSTSETGTFTLIKTTENLNFTNTSAVKGTKYFYQVRAIGENADATSAYSTVKSVTSK